METMVGIIKEINNVGGIVIPKDIRERFGLTESVEIILISSGILLRNPEYKLIKVDSQTNDE